MGDGALRWFVEECGVTDLFAAMFVTELDEELSDRSGKWPRDSAEAGRDEQIEFNRFLGVATGEPCLGVAAGEQPCVGVPSWIHSTSRSLRIRRATGT